MLCTNLVLIASILGADVKTRNVTLPVLAEWQTEDGSTRGRIQTPVGTMPSGKIKVWVGTPHRPIVYFTPVRYGVNGGKPGDIMLSPHLFDLKDKDVLTIECQEPIPSWCSTIVEIRGKPVLVALVRPLAMMSVEQWEKGGGEKEEFPNAIFFIARYGVDEMAMRVARRMAAQKEECTNYIAVVPSVGEQPVEAELRNAIADGLWAIMQKCSPNGPPISHEVEEARALLAKGRGRRPVGT